jgi:uncharacterized membrane protein YbaN (DUF454 family)
MVGYILIVLGIIGLFTPFLQGILFLSIGSAILSSQSKTFRKIKNRIEKKYPRLFACLRYKKQPMKFKE